MQPGDTFGRLTVITLFPRRGKVTRVLVECTCGNKKLVRRPNLKSGHTTSCGCYHKERVRETHSLHGFRGNHGKITATYEAWRSMLNNCYCPTSGGYQNYGSRGVTVCPRWRGDDGFIHFLKDLGSKPTDSHQLSRRNKSIGYTMTNTYWATVAEVCRNTRRTTMYTVGPRTQCLVDWAKEHNIPKNTLHYRVTDEDAFPGTINCSEHGRSPWHHVLCDACGALFDLDAPVGAEAAADSKGGYCPACGVGLLPRTGERFTARPVCEGCALELIQQRGAQHCTADPKWTPLDPRNKRDPHALN
jgi:hypothetical protein